MSPKPSSMMFRLWVKLHDRPLSRPELRTLYRECRRAAREHVGERRTAGRAPWRESDA